MWKGKRHFAVNSKPRPPVHLCCPSLFLFYSPHLFLSDRVPSLSNSQWVRYTFHSIYLPFPISIRFGPPITQHGPGNGNASVRCVRFLHPFFARSSHRTPSFTPSPYLTPYQTPSLPLLFTFSHSPFKALHFSTHVPFLRPFA